MVAAVPKAKGAAKAKGLVKGKAKAKAVVIGGSPALLKALAAPPPGPSVTEATSDDDFPSASAGASSSGAADPKPSTRGPKRDAKIPFPSIGGPAESYLVYDEYRPLKGTWYPNWEMICHHHPKCSRVRGVIPANCKHFAEDEPIAFLHAWRDTPPGPGKTHRNTDPTHEAVSAFYRDHKEEFGSFARP